jgi:hypothetical protein
MVGKPQEVVPATGDLGRTVPAVSSDPSPNLRELLVLAESVKTRVIADLERSSWPGPPISVFIENEWIHIRTNGHETGPHVLEDSEEFVAQVADVIWDGLVDIDPAALWPVCRSHDFGLHAQVHDGHAVWWCNGAGGHSEGRIGSLGVD